MEIKFNGFTFTKVENSKKSKFFVMNIENLTQIDKLTSDLEKALNLATIEDQLNGKKPVQFQIAPLYAPGNKLCGAAVYISKALLTKIKDIKIK